VSSAGHGCLPEDLGPLRSQDTLEPLVARGEVVSTVSGSRAYPTREGLIFMGFAAEDEEMIRDTMEEERLWQGTPDRVRADEKFLKTSAPRAVELVNLVRQLTGQRPGLRALELGSGSGWVSWLLATAGFDTYMCDFEPNSLYSGWIYDHPGLGPGRRIVADARFAPFADDAFDVVLLKEFAHHVDKTSQLFAEANRLLRVGGLLVLMEPTRSVWQSVYELRNPDPHEGHHITWVGRYLRQLRAQGFRQKWFSAAYQRIPRRRLARILQERSARNVLHLKKNESLFTHLHLRMFGGASVVYVGEKTSAAVPPERPDFLPIDPATLSLTPEQREAWRGCRVLAEAAAQRLR